MTADSILKRTDGFGGQADAFYEALLAAHQGLGEAESAALDARLVLILANHVGDLAVLREALRTALASLRPSGDRSTSDPPAGERA